MNKAQLKELVKNIMTEESEYQAFFKKALEKAGKSIPSMSDEEKKAFFDKIDAAWDGKGEKNEGNAFGAAVTAAKKAGEDEFEVDGETYKVKEALVGGQKELDVDSDGDIEADDLADLRAGKKADESINEEEIKWNAVENAIINFLKTNTKILDKRVKDRDTDGVKGGLKSIISGLTNAQRSLKLESVNEVGELPKATIPSAVKSKLDMAIDKIKDSDLTYNQKVQVVGKVMDSLGIDKAEFNKMASKLKGTMESVSENYNGPIIMQTGNKNALKVGEKITVNNSGKKQEFKVVKNNGNGDFVLHPVNESVNEAVSPKDMDAIKAAVQAASSFMGVGSELKKIGMKYTFATEPLPIYIIQPTPNNKVAIVNKKYASKPDFVHNDIAVGVMEGKTLKSVNEGRAFINAARKAKNEGLTEFEFNGKKYPVTIKD